MKTHLKALLALAIAAGSMIPAAGANGPETAAYAPQTGDAATSGAATEAARGETARAATAQLPAVDTLYCRRGPFTEHDTLFLYRYAAIVDGRFRDYCDLFVEHGRDSRLRRQLLAAVSPDGEENRRTLAELLGALRRAYPGPLPRHECGIERCWLSALLTEGRYYIDGLEQYPIHIADSLLIEHTQEGPWPSLLESFERVGEGHYRFATRRIAPERTCRYDLYIVDPERGIALLEEHTAAEPLYRLLVSARKARRLDLLVWRSAEMSAGNEIRRAGAEEFRRWVETFHSKQKPNK